MFAAIKKPLKRTQIRTRAAQNAPWPDQCADVDGGRVFAHAPEDEQVERVSGQPDDDESERHVE